jgi:hypothetical protein
MWESLQITEHFFHKWVAAIAKRKPTETLQCNIFWSGSWVQWTNQVKSKHIWIKNGLALIIMCQHWFINYDEYTNVWC